MEPKLQAVQEKVQAYAARLQAPASLLPCIGRIEDGQPSVIVDAGGHLSLRFVERGEMVSNEPATDEADMCYRICRDISFSMAVQYELKNRNTEQDFRRILFAQQEKLLGQLEPAWKARRQQEHELIIMQHPFDDNMHLRSDCLTQLQKAGMPYAEALKEAETRFPPLSKDID